MISLPVLLSMFFYIIILYVDILTCGTAQRPAYCIVPSQVLLVIDNELSN
jgi:hypothetical protein